MLSGTKTLILPNYLQNSLGLHSYAKMSRFVFRNKPEFTIVLAAPTTLSVQLEKGADLV